jgi:murein DD-endopeptidase MepM/ murein hydrolase activator NlpD
VGPAALVGLVVLLASGASGAPARPAPPARSAEHVHEVRPGETLSGIAKHYGVTVGALVAINRLAGPEAPIRIGWRLVIPRRGAAPATPTVAPGARPAPRRPAPPVVPKTLVLAVPDFGELLPLFSWPVEGPVSSTFGRRRNGWHRGIDIKADQRAPILAAAGGVVRASGVERRYGRVVKIEHPGGFLTVYAHNDQNKVRVGDRVFPGQLIATIGRTGRATAHHLHFEIRHDGLVYNPLYMLPLPPRVVVDESLDEEPEDHE